MLLAAGMTMTKARSKRASHNGWVAVRASWEPGTEGAPTSTGLGKLARSLFWEAHQATHHDLGT